MARISQEGLEGQTNNNNLEINGLGQDKIEVPSSDFISNSDISRDGQDLILETSDGQTLTVTDYFLAEDAPLIESPDGSILTGNLVNSFLSSDPQYAQVGSLNDESPIGAVEEITGDATITRSDGSTETLTLGSPVYQGDTIETSQDGAVNLVFIDETSMAVSESAKLSLDEYQYDPATESGTTNLSVLRGVFVFTSGLIGRDDPDDVRIDTPVGSIGIRGTIIAGNIRPGSESEISVLEGAIVIQNGLMETTLSQQYETVTVKGFRDEIENLGVQKAEKVNKTYGSVQDVLPKLFSSINDNIKQERQNRKSARNERDNDDQGDVLDADEEVVKEEVKEPEGTEKPAGFDHPILDPNFGDHFTKPNQVNVRKVIKRLIQKFLDKFGIDRPDIDPDDPVNPDILEPLPLEVLSSTPHVVEKTKAGSVFMEVFAKEGADGPVTFTFANGSTTSADGNYDIVQVSGRKALIKVNNPVTAPVTTPLATFIVKVTDNSGAEQTITLTPTVIDSVVNLNPPGGLDYHVVSGVAEAQKSIGDLNGDGYQDTINIDTTNSNFDIFSGLDSLGLTSQSAVAGLSTNNVAGIGDINNDGYDDVAYGAPNASGTGFVNKILGDGTNYVSSSVQNTGTIGDQIGYAVSGIGDIDGDGRMDFAYSILGYDAGSNSNEGRLVIADNNGIQQFVNGQTPGMQLGSKISGLGDIGGDGLSDFILMANHPTLNNVAYIYEGTTLTPAVSATIDAGTGTQIVAIGGAKDMNGDGYDDIAVSIKVGPDVNTYVIFGVNGLSGTLNMTYLENPDHALKIHHAGAGAALDADSSLHYQITRLDDINGDGFDDIQVGISGQQQFNIHGEIAGAGIPYAQDGTDKDGSGSQTSPDGWLSPINAAVKSLVGDVNFMDNNQTGLSMKGGGGNNIFDIQRDDFRDIDGGKGFDTIRHDNGGNLDFSAINYEQISQIEAIELGATSTIKLTVENIFNLLKTSDNGTLRIDGTNTSGLEIVNAAGVDGNDIHEEIRDALDDAGAGAGSATHATSGAYDHYQIGGYNLYIDTDVTTTVT